jgi:hypothetical protein
MVPLMLKRGSHPILSSVWSDLSSGNWDRIVIVKYRSRRDLVDLFVTQEFADASLHKWASIQANESLLVQAIHIPSGALIVVLFAVAVVLLIFIISAFSRRFRLTSSTE